jgi:endonuclease/exonuclease/phosphatase family metal-dependent hydrolase
MSEGPTRRSVLGAVAAGAGAALFGAGTAGATDDSAPDGEDGLDSLRAVAERVDPLRPPERLFGDAGDGWPDDPDGITVERTVRGAWTHGEATADTTTFAVDAGETVAVEFALSAGEDAADGADFDLYVTRDGRRPTASDYDRRSVTPGDDRVVLRGVDPTATLGVRVEADREAPYELVVREVVDADGRPEPDWLRPRAARRAAERNTREPLGLASHPEKGVAQFHRFSGAAREDGDHRSLRATMERHRSGSTHRFLFLNTYLLDGVFGLAAASEYEQRAREIGTAIADGDYDVVGLCEVFDVDERRPLVERLRRGYDAVDTAAGPNDWYRMSSGLYTVATGDRSITDRAAVEFEHNAGFERLAAKGVLYTEVDLGGGHAIDLFVTHLHHGDAETRQGQREQVLRTVEHCSSPENVTVVAGDFNVDSRMEATDRPEYPALLDRMADLGLEDVWLTRGGPVGGTYHQQDYDAICPLADRPGDGHYCDDYHTPGDPRDTSVRPGYRLDYVFVERPTADHSYDLDLPRVRRRPFWRGEDDPDTFWDDPRSQEGPHYMSDHLGLETEFRVTPR